MRQPNVRVLVVDDQCRIDRDVWRAPPCTRRSLEVITPASAGGTVLHRRHARHSGAGGRRLPDGRGSSHDRHLQAIGAAGQADVATIPVYPAARSATGRDGGVAQPPGPTLSGRLRAWNTDARAATGAGDARRLPPRRSMAYSDGYSFPRRDASDAAGSGSPKCPSPRSAGCESASRAALLESALTPWRSSRGAALRNRP
jgi:hypothetical protein